MKEYFRLQSKILNRKFIDFGLPLLVAYTLLPILFVWFSNFLFAKTEFAGYVYPIIALGPILRMSEPKRNDFLKTVFSRQDYFKLRLVENLICCIPFLAFLIYQRLLIIAMVLLLLAILMARFNMDTKTNFTIPTPFGKKPFEFTVGFRKTFLAFAIAYLLTFISIMVHNFNLGGFSLILVVLVCFSYYSKPENVYYVWNFSTSSKTFLFGKITTCLTNFTLLGLPIVIALSIFFIENVNILIGFAFMCYAYLTAIVLAKYSAYPDEMNLPQAILLAMCLMFPPILIGVIPFFYSKSVKNLNPILHDSN
ncbi:ABC transporter permease [Muricauda sp. 40Bstr401]|uniref:ABC transporter permease n=1 Tax=Flagellimonas sediminis TaxID=2696468 RepID=A0A6I5KQ32_9FLAO|nr:ABC transporter permease [Allomuricauda sediminis]